jgi:hypothetical protein
VEREQETSTGYFYDSKQANSQEQVMLYAKGLRAVSPRAKANPVDRDIKPDMPPVNNEDSLPPPPQSLGPANLADIEA